MEETLNQLARVQVKEIGEGDSDVSTDATNIIKNVIMVLGLACVAVMVAGGINYMTAAGDTTKAEKGKKTVTYGLVGLIVCALSFVIVNFAIINVLKIDQSSANTNTNQKNTEQNSSNNKQQAATTNNSNCSSNTNTSKSNTNSAAKYNYLTSPKPGSTISWLSNRNTNGQNSTSGASNFFNNAFSSFSNYVGNSLSAVTNYVRNSTSRVSDYVSNVTPRSSSTIPETTDIMPRRNNNTVSSRARTTFLNNNYSNPPTDINNVFNSMPTIQTNPPTDINNVFNSMPTTQTNPPTDINNIFNSMP